MLIRGPAGSGRSTLAFAMAHAMAKATEGVVLYLVTEASPSDVAYKAQSLGLGKGAVQAYARDLECAPGTVLARHVVLTRPEALEATAEELQRSALDVAFELLLQRDATPSVRALVIDSFGVPEGSSSDRVRRSELVAFLQSVEDRGVIPSSCAS